jgi:hypothetical protein
MATGGLATGSQAGLDTTTQGCPECGSLKGHRSHRRGLTEYVIVFLGGQLRRCGVCHTRYARIGESVLYLNDLARMVTRSTLIGIGVASVVAAAVIMTISS